MAVAREDRGLYFEYIYDWGDTQYYISLFVSHMLRSGNREALDQAAWRLAERWRDGVGQTRVLDEARAILRAA